MSRLPYIDPSYLNGKPHGGTRGKREYRRHVLVENIIGHDGRCHWFRGRCPECKTMFNCKRPKKRKGLYKCTRCDFTSFCAKGFFNVNKRGYDVIPPRPHEFEVPLYAVSMRYKKSDQNVGYGPAQYVIEKIEGDFYKVVATWWISPDGVEMIPVDEFCDVAEMTEKTPKMRFLELASR